jgi:hypothetical protein
MKSSKLARTGGILGVDLGLLLHEGDDLGFARRLAVGRLAQGLERRLAFRAGGVAFR